VVASLLDFLMRQCLDLIVIKRSKLSICYRRGTAGAEDARAGPPESRG